MLYNALLSLIVFMFCLSLFLVHRVSVLDSDIHSLQRDIILQLNQPRSDRVNGKMDKMSQTREPSALQKAQSSLRTSLRRVKREQSSSGASPSFLQLTPNANNEPDCGGNIAVIPWTVSVQQGNAISQKENKIVVQEDGYYLVFGQVLFKRPSVLMGHIIQKRSSMKTGTSTQLLHCLQEIDESDETPGNTCYTAGAVLLHQGDELELVLEAFISMDAESTFFGAIKIN